jgi:hypothetical protein
MNPAVVDRALSVVLALVLAIVTITVQLVLLEYLSDDLLVLKKVPDADWHLILYIPLSFFVNVGLYSYFLLANRGVRYKAISVFVVFLLTFTIFFGIYHYNPNNKIAAKSDPTVLWTLWSRDNDERQPRNGDYRFAMKYPREEGWDINCPGQTPGVKSVSGFCYVHNMKSWQDSHGIQYLYNDPAIPENTPGLCYLKITYPFTDIHKAVTTINNITDKERREDCDNKLALIKGTIEHVPYK